ncbi:MAG: flavodoxin family protein [Methanomicrobiales archaeon]|jgi:multimeric flavodoxin WrbA|nr:flavodoxin family protein [Methanomicrobiales archaeon]
MISIITVMGSPRRHGNTEKLLDQFIRGVHEEKRSADIHIEKVILRDLDIQPCKGCNACHKAGVCIIQDDAITFYEKIMAANVLIFAFPIYTMSVPAEVKAVIDRAHYIWVRRVKNQLETISKEYKDSHLAFVFLTAGMSLKNRPDLFDAVHPTMSALFNNLGYTQRRGIYADGMDESLGIEGRPELLEQAYQLVQSIVQELVPYDTKDT